ncbi:MAG: hypothetical protein IK107_05805 [Oscillospiraceae bacterium]|nr:hypothetical protein [Oscillospiraceae bacterium]
MKKLLAAVSAAVLAVCSVSASAFAINLDYVPTWEEVSRKGYAPEYALGEDLSLYSLGDVDMDGEVTAYDACIILSNFTFNLAGWPDVLTEDQLMLADVDGESIWFEDDEKWVSATAMDATIVMTYAGLKNAGYEFTFEEYLAEELYKSAEELLANASK